ncbi:hypothetical protein DFH28DRAFT_324146 [Melampsora americana]|nr:hypothetical protein DFH28DRAFT_324146 [Melampsora americana]
MMIKRFNSLNHHHHHHQDISNHNPKFILHSIRLISLSSNQLSSSYKSTLSSSHDLVGPPSSRSNLRPVKYAPLFSSAPISSSESSSSTPHPYSLNEFHPQPIHLSSSLNELRNKLHLEDLEWIKFRERIDEMNERFWSDQSTKFEALEEAEKERIRSSIEDFNSTSSAIEHQSLTNSNLDQFYKSWLLNEQTRFKDYNLNWWKSQPKLLYGSWKSQKRSWNWKLAWFLHRWGFL